MKNIGIIGVGHLGSALLQGLLKSKQTQPANIFISGGSSGKAQKLATALHCNFCTNNRELIEKSDVIILAVIPRLLPAILDEIARDFTENKIIISVAASFSLDQIYQHIPQHISVIRAIPNIPSEVCQGMTAISVSAQVTNEQLTTVKQLFSAIGQIAIVEEKKLEISSTVAGCSPAYVALFIEALSDAGVIGGLSRDEAYLLSKQAVLGAASVLLEQNMLPAELKDRVSSPGGTTIRGIAALEKNGLRNAVIEAVKASAKITD